MRTREEIEIAQMFTLAPEGVLVLDTSDSYCAIVHKPKEGYKHIDTILKRNNTLQWYEYRTKEELAGIEYKLCELCFIGD